MSTILIADEDLLIHILIRMALDDASDICFLEARHTGEAVKFAREHQGSIDLLLCDMEMPGEQDATEFVALFSAMHPAAKVLMMLSQDVPALPKNPGWHYILKPFRAAEVLRKIELVLGAGADGCRQGTIAANILSPSEQAFRRKGPGGEP